MLWQQKNNALSSCMHKTDYHGAHRRLRVIELGVLEVKGVLYGVRRKHRAKKCHDHTHLCSDQNFVWEANIAIEGFLSQNI